MKKGNILIIVLAFALVVAVGYALFSDNIVINGTASAQGDFKFEATCTTGLTIPGKTIQDLIISSRYEKHFIENGYNNDSCTYSGTTVNMKVNFDYPTAARLFTVKLTNTGSIEGFVMPDFDMYEEIKRYVDGVEQTTTFGKNLLNIRIVSYISENGTNLVDSHGFNPTDLNELRIKPGNSIYLLYSAYWDDEYGSLKYEGEDLKADFTTRYNIMQMTEEIKNSIDAS